MKWCEGPSASHLQTSLSDCKLTMFDIEPRYICWGWVVWSWWWAVAGWPSPCNQPGAGQQIFKAERQLGTRPSPCPGPRHSNTPAPDLDRPPGYLKPVMMVLSLSLLKSNVVPDNISAFLVKSVFILLMFYSSEDCVLRISSHHCFKIVGLSQETRPHSNCYCLEFHFYFYFHRHRHWFQSRQAQKIRWKCWDVIASIS